MHGQHDLPVARPQTKAPFGGFHLHLVPNGVFSAMLTGKNFAGSGDKGADQKPAMPTGAEAAVAAPATDLAKRPKSKKVRFQPYEHPPPVLSLLTPTQVDLSDKNSRHVTRVMCAKL